MCNFQMKPALMAIMILFGSARVSCQTALPEVLEQGSISEQLDYIQERTRIYEGYRAIREDMFQRLSRNAIDSLNDAKLRIDGLELQSRRLDRRIDSLISSLEATRSDLNEMTRTKNSIRLFGKEVNKVPYNAIMWTIIAVLLFLLVTGYLAFMQTRNVTTRTQKDLDELREEFEDYRTKTRLEREKTALNHFNEIKKLKGK